MSTASTLFLDIQLPLDRFDLEVRTEVSGPVAGVFGASGAGKTSLLETIAGLRRGARGRIALGDTVWLDSARRVRLPAERRQIGYVPQDGLLFPHLDVRGNLLSGRRARTASSVAGHDVDTVARLLELEPLLGRGVVDLSGGERRRVALGRALCSGPALLLLDEPLANLDLPMRRRLLPFLRRVRAALSVPMVVVSHDPFEIQTLCDHVMVLRRGAVVDEGPPAPTLRRAQSDETAEGPPFENALIGRWRDDGTVALPGARAVTVAEPPGEADEEVVIGLSATDVVLALDRPAAISARNILPAQVEAITEMDGHALVTTRLGGPNGDPSGTAVAVEVAAATPASLGLEVGRPVYLLIKATACRVFRS